MLGSDRKWVKELESIRGISLAAPRHRRNGRGRACRVLESAPAGAVSARSLRLRESGTRLPHAGAAGILARIRTMGL